MKSAAQDKSEILSSPVFNSKWYHSIELLPGVVTKGSGFKNIVVTRRLLEPIEVESTRCLDIGAMDCLVSLLLERRGADQVVAYERSLLPKKHVELIRSALKPSFLYIDQISLREVPYFVQKLNLYPFDVVVFSGVLYHTLDPLSSLAMTRSLVRNGGILLLETAAINDDTCELSMNARKRYILDGTTYWLPTVGCIEYMLRFLRLKVLDAAYFILREDRVTRKELIRLGVTARAEVASLAGEGEQGDEFLDAPRNDLQEVGCIWEKMDVGDRSDVLINEDKKCLKYSMEPGIPLFQLLQEINPLEITDEDKRLTLYLKDMV